MLTERGSRVFLNHAEAQTSVSSGIRVNRGRLPADSDVSQPELSPVDPHCGGQSIWQPGAASPGLIIDEKHDHSIPAALDVVPCPSKHLLRYVDKMNHSGGNEKDRSERNV